ncbi:MAG: adenylate/guanylate cyclase domain-containing protein [Solirubrobacterales bacterium]|nr:adenylate/guanylate cyclase domain-containing protein [Solirubrobacterales bacterium]
MRQHTTRYQQRRRYPMSVPEAWRLLADTDHLNRSIGLPPVEFSPLPDPLLRGAQAKAWGFLPVRWKEFPFEWVRERRYVVRREFEIAPLSAVEVGIELEPDGDGVIITSFADFISTNPAGRVLSRLGKAPVSGLLDFCDRYLVRKAAGKADPTPTPEKRTPVDHVRLEQAIQRVRAYPVAVELIGPLRERIIEGSDDQLVRVRPFALADTWRADRLEVLRLFLYATRAGLFELRWQLMCPNCRVPKQEVEGLAQLPVQFHCEVCGISYGTEFDRGVELRFSIHPSVRAATDLVYCIGGPLRMSHIAAQQYLRPHEERGLAITPTEALRLRTVGSSHHLTIAPGPPASRPTAVKLTYADGRWVAPHSLIREERLELPRGSTLSVRNQTGGPVLAVVEEAAWTGDATTAAEVTALQEFRDLFSSEVLAPGQQHAIRHIALLFSDLKGSTQLYEGIGDAAAYGRVNRHFDFIRQAVVRLDGSVVKTMGDGVMCAFRQLDDALEAALAIQEQVVDWCRAEQIDPPLVLKLGVHVGPVIAMTANDRLDYFGRTVNVAARLGDQSRGGDIVMLREVLDQASTRPDMSVEHFTRRLRGLDSEQQLARLTLRPSEGPARGAGKYGRLLEPAPGYSRDR